MANIEISHFAKLDGKKKMRERGLRRIPNRRFLGWKQPHDNELRASLFYRDGLKVLLIFL